MAGISYSDSVKDIDKSSRLPIDDVFPNTEDKMIRPDLIINLAEVGRKDTGVSVISTENRLENEDFPGDDYPSPGIYQQVYLAEAAKDNNIIDSELPGEDMSTAIEAYDNANMDFDSYMAMGGKATNLVDKLDELGNSISVVNDTNIDPIKISVEFLYEQLGIEKTIKISTEEYENAGSKAYTHFVKESISETITNSFKKIIEFIKNLWNKLATAIKSLFHKVYDYITKKAKDLKDQNDKAPNTATERALDNYTGLKIDLANAFGRDGKVDSSDVYNLIKNQLRTKDFLNDLNTNSLMHVMELITRADESKKDLSDYKEFFNDTFLPKVVSKLKDIDFVYHVHLLNESEGDLRLGFSSPIKKEVAPHFVPGYKSTINEIIDCVLNSNDIVKLFYSKVDAINTSKNEVLDKLTLDFSHFNSSSTLESSKHVSKLLTLFFMDLASVIKNVTYYSSMGNKMALKYCELSIRVREGKA